MTSRVPLSSKPARGWRTTSGFSTSAKEQFIVGFVGNLSPGSEGFATHLDRFAKDKLFRGIRVRGEKLRREMADRDFLSDVQKMADKDLSLDILCGPDALLDIARLAKYVPSLRIVVNHVAGVRIDGEAPDPKWVEGIEAVAKQPHVFCKVSGLVEATGMKPAPSNLSYYKPTIDVIWSAFGEDRIIYGSNWPVCELFSDYATVYNIVREYFKRINYAAEKYFYENSKVVYKWIQRG